MRCTGMTAGSRLTQVVVIFGGVLDQYGVRQGDTSDAIDQVQMAAVSPEGKK